MDESSPLVAETVKVINKEEDEEEPQAVGQTGTFSAIFIVVNAAMGAGLLNMPRAFSNAGGIVYGMLIQLVGLLMVYFA